MDAGIKSKLAILMGIVIGLTDLYWIYISYYPIGRELGAIIFIANLIWLGIDLSFIMMMKKK